MWLRPPQIEIAETQTRLFRCIDLVFDWKWRRLGVIQNVQLRSVHFDFAGGQLRIGFLPLHNVAFDCDHEFAARLFCFAVSFGLRLFIEDHLDNSGAVAHIEKQQIAEVAAARDPAENDGGFTCVGCAKRSAVVCALQITEKVQHGVVPFRNANQKIRPEARPLRIHSRSPLTFTLVKNSNSSGSVNFRWVPSAKVFSVQEPSETSLSPRMRA